MALVNNQVGPTWPPDRKIWAGGLASLVAWGILYGLGRAGVALPPELQAMLVPAVGYVISYVTPPSIRDIVTRVNNDIVKLANADQNNPTTAKVVSDHESVMVARTDIATGAVDKARIPLENRP